MTQTIIQQPQAVCRGGLLTASCLLLPPTQVVVQLTDDLLSQAVMMVEDSRPTLAINLAGARQYWLEGMLRHEIGQRGRGSDGDREEGGGRASPDGLASPSPKAVMLISITALGLGEAGRMNTMGLSFWSPNCPWLTMLAFVPHPTQAPTTSAG